MTIHCHRFEALLSYFGKHQFVEPFFMDWFKTRLAESPDSFCVTSSPNVFRSGLLTALDKLSAMGDVPSNKVEAAVRFIINVWYSSYSDRGAAQLHTHECTHPRTAGDGEDKCTRSVFLRIHCHRHANKYSSHPIATILLESKISTTILLVFILIFNEFRQVLPFPWAGDTHGEEDLLDQLVKRFEERTGWSRNSAKRSKASCTFFEGKKKHSPAGN